MAKPATESIRRYCKTKASILCLSSHDGKSLTWRKHDWHRSMAHIVVGRNRLRQRKDLKSPIRRRLVRLSLLSVARKIFLATMHRTVAASVLVRRIAAEACLVINRSSKKSL